MTSQLHQIHCVHSKYTIKPWEPASALTFFFVNCEAISTRCIRTTVTVHPPKFDSIQSAGRLLAAVSMVNHLIYSSSKEYKKN